MVFEGNRSFVDIRFNRYLHCFVLMTYRRFAQTGDSLFTVCEQFKYSSVSLVQFDNQTANLKFYFIDTLCARKYTYPLSVFLVF